MATTLTSTGVTFSSGNAQTEAVTTTAGGVGSYVLAYTAFAGPKNYNTTDVGSNLRRATNGSGFGIETSGASNYYMLGTKTAAITLSSYSFSGTWRVMTGAVASSTTPQLWVRIS